MNWHAGEQALHLEAGVAQRMAEIGPRALREHMPLQHRAFYAELPLLFTGLVDEDGQPWASLVAGPLGFVSSPTPQRLHIAAQPLAGDPAAALWQEGAPVALLGLQAETGRRNRANGRIVRAGSEGLEVRVEQSFGNCPRFIHPREALYVTEGAPAQVFASERLDAASARLVAAADTFFIASAHPQAVLAQEPSAGVDVSHRGGPAGFVRLQADGTLLVPDYAGNMFFNTLGNLRLEPRCGLLFIDFATGERLHLACRAAVLPQPPDAAQWPGAARLLRFGLRAAVRVEGGLPLRWREA